MKKLFLLLIISTAFIQAEGQDLYNNGALISIKSNTIFSTDKGFTNNGELTNDGSLQIGGTWMNNGTYNEADGDITLTSEEEQVVNHNSQSFSRLSITGGGIKTFEANLTIIDELSLSDGILQSVDGAQLILSNDATIVGGSDNSYVDGVIISQGTGNKFFPLGSNNTFLPVELVNVSGLNPEIAFSINEPLSGVQTSDDIIEISQQHFWKMEVLSGTFDGSLIGLGIRDETFPTDLVNTVVVEANDAESSFRNLGQSSINGSATDGFIVSSDEVSGTIFSIGLIEEDLPETTTIKVINAISPNGDGIHDFLRIDNITSFPDNVLTIYNRWGDPVFESSGYDNTNGVFEGFSNKNGSNELLDGTYFYVINKNDGSKAKTGYIEIRR